MKKKINLNYFYAQVFVKQLKRLGLKHVCISPGSRNTPLTLAFAAERGIKKHVIVDERSSAFFALGLAKKTSLPVAVLTTSGTATAELYPAIIEAYNSRTPLIIITADRPPELIGTGANQTIKQHNLYANHIRLFEDAGLPKTNHLAIKRLQAKAQELYYTALFKDTGPVHINFPLRKPLEPFTHNTEIDNELHRKYLNEDIAQVKIKSKTLTINSGIIAKILSASRPLILTGWYNYSEGFHESVLELARALNAPILADATSPLRYLKPASDIVISTAGNFLRTDKADEEFEPDLILQFGNTPIVNSLLEYFARVKTYKILINKHGDILDPSRTFDKIIAYPPESFCKDLLSSDKWDSIPTAPSDWKMKWIEAEKKTVEHLKKEIWNSAFPFEGRITREVIQSLPKGSDLFVSNSMPIRDLDTFGEKTETGINIYTNRGTSGIDGINSTALGIASISSKRTYLLTGDLAFFHDMNGLWTAKEYGINLTVILINNGGGGIFKLLPIAKDKKYFEAYFTTALNLDFAKTAELYEAEYCSVTSWKDLRDKLKSSRSTKGLQILEIKADADKSAEKRIAFSKYIKSVFGN